MPYLGPLEAFPNVIAATGHAMMGVSLGPVTGKLVSEFVSERKPSVESPLLDPGRF
jgi:D-amino-acid dehydrogenase